MDLTEDAWTAIDNSKEPSFVLAGNTPDITIT
jgi:hypothetical protein